MEKIMNRIRVEFFIILLVFSFSLKAEIDRPVEIKVYRSASCGCCSKWVDHLKENKFIVKDYVVDDVQIVKDKNGVPKSMASCHTALVNGYVVEGHVPAKDIMRLLKEKPRVVGISVPGMPVGTPGMEMGGRKDPYEVVSFDKNNNYQVFSKYE
jgi:hypothetical protein